jgi:hypothetical protein
MKIITNSRGVSLCFVSLTLLISCGERTGGTGSRDLVKDTLSNSISAAQIAGWVDYVNYKVSRHALLKDTAKLRKYDAATINSKSYDSVLSVLKAIRSVEANESQNEVLAKEINTLKNINTISVKKMDLATFFSDSIFKDSVKYKNINAFYQKRIKTEDSTELLALKSVLKNEINDSIKNLLAKPTIKDSIPGETSKQSNDKDSKDKNDSLMPIILITSTLLITALAVFNWLKKRRKNNPNIPADSDTGDQDTAPNKTKEQTSEDNYKTENEKLWRKVKEQEQKIAKLEQEFTRHKHVSAVERTTPSENINIVLYFPAPNNGNFPASTGSSTKRSIDAYQLEVTDGRALFSLITNDSEVVKRSLVTPNIYILPVCEIDGDSGLFSTATSIKLLEKGQLQKEGDQWILKKKSLIKLV